MRYSLIILCTLFCFWNANAQNIGILPQPQSVKTGNGNFHFNKKTSIAISPEAHSAAAAFQETVGLSTKKYKFRIHPVANTNSTENVIYFLLDNNFPDTTIGAYSLDITEKNITAKAKNILGLFYAAQSLGQLFDINAQSQEIPSASIQDAPRYAWRGFMLDVSRTFYSVDVVKKYLDVMALYKLNVFHWHLSDDQGWRIEIKSHPELTSTKATVFGASSQQPAYRSGYYTQEQIRDIVRYATAKHITIVPEIDVPGHCWPIVITNPQLGINNKLNPDYVVSFMDSYNYWGYQFTPNPLDPTKETVYTFLKDVFSEIAGLFPGEYIHFGGDEVRHNLWENEAHVKAFMKAHNMQKIEELQSYFVQRISEIIRQNGKKPIGWNDILADADHLPKTTAIMSWIGAGAVKDAAKYGFPVVASPTGPLYFDISQDNINDGTMVDWNYGGGDGVNGKGNTIKKVYAYNPEQGLSDTEKKYVLGVQANMWTALAQEVKDVNIQVFPRLLALAEVAWTAPEHKSGYEDFQKRLALQYPLLDALNVDYFLKGGYIVHTWMPADVTTDFKTMQWDITPQVYTAGRGQAGFLFTSGSSFLKVKNVKLLENGKEVASDIHESVANKFRGTPFKKNMFFYILPLKKYNAKAKYTLQADIAGNAGTDSYGNITFSMSPEKPFTVTQASKK